MTVTNTPVPEISAPEVLNPIEQGLINKGLIPKQVQDIGAVLALFSERQETVPMSIKAGINQARAEKAEQALENAEIDYVTGLKGPKKFWEDIDSYAKRLRGESPDRRSVAVFFCDLSGLKRLNDTYGNTKGDLYLKETALALQKFTRPDDSWYRLGDRSDELAGIIHGVKPDKKGLYDENIAIIVEKLVAKVRQHLFKAGLPVGELRLGILIAGDMLKPGETAQELFERVDAKLREKKSEVKKTLPDHLAYDNRLI